MTTVTFSKVWCDPETIGDRVCVALNYLELFFQTCSNIFSQRVSEKYYINHPPCHHPSSIIIHHHPPSWPSAENPPEASQARSVSRNRFHEVDLKSLRVDKNFSHRPCHCAARGVIWCFQAVHGWHQSQGIFLSFCRLKLFWTCFVW